MIVVVAGYHDEAARSLVARWGADRAALLTCEDLSVPGWRHYVAAAGNPMAVIDGRKVAPGEITGVVTCLPHVSELELLHIVPSDRAYVAAEMSAFLLSWLSALSCPVVNRPSPTCLCGPYWRPEQWASVAAQVGMRVQPVHRRVALADGSGPAVPDGVTVTVVGGRCLGHADTTVMAAARRLAQAADVDLLTLHVGSAGPDATFLGASPWPDLNSDETVDAVLEYILEKGKEHRDH
jgi:hypothetical protein